MLRHRSCTILWLGCVASGCLSDNPSWDGASIASFDTSTDTDRTSSDADGPSSSESTSSSSSDNESDSDRSSTGTSESDSGSGDCTSDDQCPRALCGPSGQCQDGGPGDPCENDDHCNESNSCGAENRCEDDSSTSGSTGDCEGAGCPCLGITDVDVTIDIRHTWIGDLVIKLVAPDDTSATLVSAPGVDEPADDGVIDPNNDGDSSNVNGPITFDDDAATSSELMGLGVGNGGTICVDNGVCEYASSGFPMTNLNLSELNGLPPAGSWTLCIGDAVANDFGLVRNWEVTIQCGGEVFTGSSGMLNTSLVDDGYDGSLGSMTCSSVNVQ